MQTPNFFKDLMSYFMKVIVTLMMFLFTAFGVYAYYPKETLKFMQGIHIKGNGRVIQLHPDSERSKPIISWYDFESGEQAAWLVTHDRQPEFEGYDRHRHFSIETSKAKMGWLTTRMEFPYGKDIIDIGIYDSNLKLNTGLFMYYNAEKTAGSFFHPDQESFITFAPRDMKMKSKTGSFLFYADGDPSNRKQDSEVIVYGEGNGNEFVRLAHNGSNAILQTKAGTLVVDQKYHTPKNSGETCQPKALAFDEDYIYICSNTEKWGRTSLEYDW